MVGLTFPTSPGTLQSLEHPGYDGARAGRASAQWAWALTYFMGLSSGSYSPPVRSLIRRLCQVLLEAQGPVRA